jgi:hypothetical protein
MNHYAMIFRATRQLSPEELKRRQVEISAWARKVMDTGIKLDPRNIGETAANFSKQAGEILLQEGPSDPTITAIVFFDCPSREQAVEIARIHPGLNYGVKVELRQWLSPAETAAKQ